MKPDVNSLFVVLFCLLRCLVPIIILLGITYLLKRLGWLPTEPPEAKG